MILSQSYLTVLCLYCYLLLLFVGYFRLCLLQSTPLRHYVIVETVSSLIQYHWSAVYIPRLCLYNIFFIYKTSVCDPNTWNWYYLFTCILILIKYSLNFYIYAAISQLYHLCNWEYGSKNIINNCPYFI